MNNNTLNDLNDVQTEKSKQQSSARNAPIPSQDAATFQRIEEAHIGTLNIGTAPEATVPSQARKAIIYEDISESALCR
jgi:hypothetical protein